MSAHSIRPEPVACAPAEPFADHCPDPDRVRLMGVTRGYRRGQEIFGEGERADHVYSVISGAVRAFRVLSDGRRQISDFYLPAQNLTIQDQTVTRGQATAGLQYQFPFVANTQDASHIIEPIGQVVTRPNTSPQSQWKIPDEDARSLVFDDTDLFSRSKFSGTDRMETGTRVNAGMQYTFQLNSGGYARALAGQSYQISGANPFAVTNLDPLGSQNFSPNSGLQRNTSDYVTAFYIAPNQYFRLISQQRFDEGDFSLRRQDTAGTVTWGPGSVTAAYSFTKADPNTSLLVGTTNTALTDQREISVGGSLKLTDTWSLSATTLYDIQSNKFLQDSATIKYADECFVLSLQYIETFITDPTRAIIPDRTVMLRFELKNLGQYGYSNNISGNQQAQASAGGIIGK